MASRRDVVLRPPPSSVSSVQRPTSRSAFLDRSLDNEARSDEPPWRRCCLPAAVTHRRQLRSIHLWHRAARWQVAGTSRLPCRRGLDATPRSGRRGRRVGSRAVGGGKAQAAAPGRSQLTSERRRGSRKKLAGRPWIRADVGGGFDDAVVRAGTRGRRGARSTSAGQQGAGKPKRSSARSDRGSSHSPRIR